MRFLTTLITVVMARGQQRSNLRALVGLVGLLVVIVVTFSVFFHLLMVREGQVHSWFTSTYWTIVTMSTLGFGDVTFSSDLGRMFSVIVVVTGTMLMLIILPFTFIQFFYAPWLEARDAARAPRKLDPSTSGHVLLTGYGPVDRALIKRLVQFRTPHAVIVPDLKEALALDSEGVPVMIGELRPRPRRGRGPGCGHAVGSTQHEHCRDGSGAIERRPDRCPGVVARVSGYP